MITKFTKMQVDDFPHKWSRFFTAGDAWLESLQILTDNKDQVYWGRFYVIPYVAAFCFELYVKAIVARIDNTFDGKEYSHKITEIIKCYKDKIQIFNKIFSDKKIMKVIEEFENTKDTRFGETFVSINGNDEQIIIDTIYELRSEMCKITGLR